ncbi:MAG TPA: LysR substrate-binding domain-containing protein [Ramlibacter sp.]|uniref:LysR substrate-binding domain-containing protein n=1 Tax=Ramlibacter sp. TaxID=1917967 RepID=UPI002CE8D443|nr:LysR substrate-binding domain-containing protein [Ramlibacter sp.]HVZ46824.1 LysR substrate-binding domain-containing protein [Ramlibacter sp.]
MPAPLNYHHLYYFWVVAKEGGIARGADRLGMAVQTVSAQVHALEQSLGYALLKPAGRGLALTEAGLAALASADRIFQLGEELPSVVRDAALGQSLRLRAGISDGLPKLVARHMLQPAVQAANARLLCHEDEFERLLADLALHRLDAVLSDRPAPANPNLRLYSHRIGEAPLAWFAPAALAKRRAKFPRSLGDLPLLLPTSHAAVRPHIDQWLEQQGLRPRIVGEFEDSALLAAFGRSGMGAFPASVLSREELLAGRELVLLGEVPQLRETYYLISAERRIQHPVVQKLLEVPLAS